MSVAGEKQIAFLALAVQAVFDPTGYRVPYRTIANIDGNTEPAGKVCAHAHNDAHDDAHAIEK